MGENEQDGRRGGHVRGLVRDRVARSFLASSFSCLTTLVFAGYNLFLWIAYGAAWNAGIAVYYALLGGIRLYVLLSEWNLYRRGADEEEIERARRKLFTVQSVLLFVIDLALVAPISLMVMQQREIGYTEIPAISMAAYTTYKVAAATASYAKRKKSSHLSLRILRTVNLVDALVSVLTLQYTLVMTFGGSIGGIMLTVCAASSFAIWGGLIVLSVFTLIEAVRLRKVPSSSSAAKFEKEEK